MWVRVPLTPLLENDMSTSCPNIEPDYEVVLKWAEENKSAKIEWDDEWVDSENNITKIPNMAMWTLVWQYGFISVYPDKDKSKEILARRVAAMFIYLYENNVEVSLASRLASYYVSFETTT